MSATNTASPLARVLITIVLFGIIYFLIHEVFAPAEMNHIENQVADDQVRQYDIVKAHGTPTEVCVHAGIVAAAYVQAKDDENYRKWEAIKQQDCAAAGLPDN